MVDLAYTVVLNKHLDSGYLDVQIVNFVAVVDVDRFLLDNCVYDPKHFSLVVRVDDKQLMLDRSLEVDTRTESRQHYVVCLHGGDDDDFDGGVDDAHDVDDGDGDCLV